MNNSSHFHACSNHIANIILHFLIKAIKNTSVMLTYCLMLLLANNAQSYVRIINTRLTEGNLHNNFIMNNYDITTK